MLRRDPLFLGGSAGMTEGSAAKEVIHATYTR